MTVVSRENVKKNVQSNKDGIDVGSPRHHALQSNDDLFDVDSVMRSRCAAGYAIDSGKNLQVTCL